MTNLTYHFLTAYLTSNVYYTGLPGRGGNLPWPNQRLVLGGLMQEPLAMQLQIELIMNQQGMKYVWSCGISWNIRKYTNQRRALICINKRNIGNNVLSKVIVRTYVYIDKSEYKGNHLRQLHIKNKLQRAVKLHHVTIKRWRSCQQSHVNTLRNTWRNMTYFTAQCC